MPFPFTLLCDLLNRLQRNHKPSSFERTQEAHTRTVVSWFSKHNEAIPRRGSEAIAFLSCLFPERRPDRVFSLPTRQLEKMIESTMPWVISYERSAEVEIQRRLGPNVTLGEIDEVLDQIAASSPFSSMTLKERVKQKYGQSIQRDNLLLRLFRRLRSSEAKWMIRMLSKNYSPAQVPETLAMGEFHFLLPDLLQVQSTIHAAVDLLDASTIRCMPIQPAADTRNGLREAARWELKPQVGTMAARPIYDKARSIRHCCQLASTRRMSVERKKAVNVFDDTHPTRINWMSNLALCLQEEEQFDEGLELGRRVMALSKEVLGDDHPDTLIRMSNQAIAYNAQGKQRRAEEIMANVVQKCRIKLGDDHPSTLISMYNLALIHIGQGAWHVAQGIWASIVGRICSVLGEKHPCTVRCKSYLSLLDNTSDHNEEETNLEIE